MFALFPPFDTICVLTTLVAIGLALSFRAVGKGDPARPKRPIPWGWLALYFVALAVLFVGLLLLGHYVDPSHSGPHYGP